MSLSEFEIIERYFARRGAWRDDVLLGVGDDAALLAVAPGRSLVAAVDTLVDGVHFPRGTAAEDIGYRALAVNLSDLAAMGAEPAWATLALTLPEADEGWLEGFAAGFHALAESTGVALVGGDTTRGPLTVSVALMGSVPAAGALRRDGGRPGDLLFVTGTPGDAAAGLALLQSADLAGGVDAARLRGRFLRPAPRLAEGRSLRTVASAVIDVSDGLVADALRLAQASGVGLALELERLPLSEELLAGCGPEEARRYALGGGDDYELLFAVATERIERLEVLCRGWSCRCTRIGALTAEPGLQARLDGAPVELPESGYRHF